MGQGTSAKGLGQQSGGLTAHRGGGGKEEDLAGLRASVRTGTCPLRWGPWAALNKRGPAGTCGEDAWGGEGSRGGSSVVARKQGEDPGLCSQLASNSQSSCLCLPSAGVAHIRH
jgi:hypothetical protein